MNLNKQAVSNSSPLILLAKIGKLDYLFNLFENIFIPLEVYKETVVRGIHDGFQDAVIIDEAIKIKLIIVKETKKMYKEDELKQFLHEGEIKAISLAKELSSNTILLDDEEARIYARNIGLKVKGTIGIVIDNVLSKKITKKEGKESLKKLNRIMFLSGEIYEYALERITKIE
ncbi:MAG: hypothetical protein HeimC3_24770 [Candidatus Heimdallarchaeota archaeon LC_3]|nr:MAG: hypothetical protein HeimC3_41100 [Candidatus Heimdallarchaeota archaeon LC_3]OLS23402.1 MAG: hypothetical protein HeimC3_24770 [Candidatus Heimdallarchaeota archaeon LC_3]